MRVVGLVVICLALTPVIDAVVIASGQLELCDQSSTALTCKNRLVSTFTLDGNQAVNLQASLSSVSSTTGSQQLQKSLNFAIARSRPQMAYPFYFLREYNSKPTERIVYVQDVLVPQCKDGDQEASPTCGWQYDSSGKKIPYSQGFCCSCSLSQMLGLSHDGTRSALNCQLFSTAHSSASCMQLNPLYYNAYEIGSGIKNFDITVTITQQGTTTPLATLKAGPTNPVVLDQATGVKLSLDGDFASYTNPPTFDSKLAFVPSRPSTSVRVQNIQKYTMILDKSFTGTASQCDVIGTGYQAFRLQANGCEAQPNACLQNQIEDYYQQDVARVAKGQNPIYSTAAYGNFVLDTGNSTSANYNLLYYITGGSSLLTIEINADSLKFISNVSPGKITNAYVNDFTSLSRSGTMIVAIKNTGTIDAGYSIIIKDCSSNILAIPSISIQVSAGQTETSTVPINTNTYMQTSNKCSVYLMDSTSTQQDMKVVPFTALTQVTAIPESADDQSGVTKETQTSTSGCAM
jgi:hypothetical protein